MAKAFDIAKHFGNVDKKEKADFAKYLLGFEKKLPTKPKTKKATVNALDKFFGKNKEDMLRVGYAFTQCHQTTAGIYKDIFSELEITCVTPKDAALLVRSTKLDPKKSEQAVKLAKKKKTEIEELFEEETEEEGGEMTWEDLAELKLKDLKKLIKEKDLDTDASDHKGDLEGLREAIAEELEIEVEEEGGEEESGEEEGGDEDGGEETDLSDMDHDELSAFVEEHDLEIDPDDYDPDEELEEMREAIAEALGEESNEDGGEESEESGEEGGDDDVLEEVKELLKSALEKLEEL